MFTLVEMGVYDEENYGSEYQMKADDGPLCKDEDDDGSLYYVK